MSATAYETTYPAYSRSSFQTSMATVGSSHLSPLFDVSPLLYPPTPLRDVSSSSATFLPNDATQQHQPQRFTTLAQHVHNDHASSAAPSSTSHAQHQPNLSTFFATLTSTSAPQSPLSSLHHHTASSTHYFDYTDPTTHRADPLSVTHQQQLLQHRILQQQLAAKAAVMVPASPVSVQSDANSVSGGSGGGQDLFANDSSSSTTQSPQHLSSVSSMSSLSHTPPPLQPSALPPPAQQSQPAVQSSLGAEGRKRKGVLSRKIACNVCHLAKTSCDGARPCSRCVRLMKTSQCVDRPSKMAKNRAVQPTAEDTNVAAAAAVTAARAAAASSGSPGVDAASANRNNAEFHSTAASSDQLHSASSSHQSTRPLSAVIEDVAIEDANDDSDRSLPHSHSQSQSGDEWCDDVGVSEHASCASDVGSDSSESSSAPSSPPIEAHISRSLLRAHINWINKQHGDTSSSPTARMDLREKLLYFNWICHMMLPVDVEQIIHFSGVYHSSDHDCNPQSPHHSNLHSHTHNHTPPPHIKRPFPPPPAATSRAFRHRQPHQPCDGTVCNNFCPTARAWSAANPVVFTWHQSPEQAVVSDGFNHSYAVLVCRNLLQDAAESEQQSRQIVANTLLLREREKERERSKLAAARRTADTIHISPIVEEGGAASSSSTPQPSSSPAEGALSLDDMGSFSAIVNQCGGMSPQDMHHLRAVRESQQRQEEADTKSTSSFSALMLRCSTTPPTTSSVNDLHTSAAPPSSASTSTTLSSSPSPTATASSLSLSLPPAPPIEVPMSVSVNPAFERLFGYSQAELRQHLIRDGGRALYLLTRRDEWERLMGLDQEVTWGREHEYKTYAVIVTKWAGEVRCLVHTIYERNDDGKWKQSTTSFIPLPEDSKPSGRSRRDARDGHRRRSASREGERERERRRRRKDADRKGGRGGSSGSGDGVRKERRGGRDEDKRS